MITKVTQFTIEDNEGNFIDFRDFSHAVFSSHAPVLSVIKHAEQHHVPMRIGYGIYDGVEEISYIIPAKMLNTIICNSLNNPFVTRECGEFVSTDDLMHGQESVLLIHGFRQGGKTWEIGFLIYSDSAKLHNIGYVSEGTRNEPDYTYNPSTMGYLVVK